MNKVFSFNIWTLVFFLIPLGWALAHQIYVQAAILSLIIFISLIFHLSDERKFRNLDMVMAWFLMLTNTTLIVLGDFQAPYFYLALIFAIAAIYFWKIQSSSKYYHGTWHIFSSLVTLFSLFTFIY